MSDRLTPELVLRGYCAGIFPMACGMGEIEWFSPDPRCIFEFDRLRISRSLRRTLSRGTFETRVNTAFRHVLAACADRGEGTWISPLIARVYTELFEQGFAHCVESWRDGRLVGGLYGVAIGGAFFGESMFHRETDASKVALVRLVERLRERGYTLLDTQWATPHLRRLGAIEIPRRVYLRRLEGAVALPRSFTDASPVTQVREAEK